jgi:phosphopantothenoylcysteine decarboxylase/phosphopantothenate--cysteine ligase
MKTKNTDFIVLNSLKDAGAGFGVDTNQVTVFAASGEKKLIPLQSKEAVATEIIDFVSRGKL